VDWLTYFTQSRTCRPPIPWERGISLAPQVRAPLLESLQRFQVGESGDGAHLIAAAQARGDATYVRRLRLFVAEEQEHARLLAGLVRALGGECLAAHWSSDLFTRLRHIGGLEGELLVLLTAEIVGLAYYRALRDRVSDPVLHAVVTRMVRDEEAHLPFHCDALGGTLGLLPAWRRQSIRACWQAFSVGVFGVAWYSHHHALESLEVSRTMFHQSCLKLLYFCCERSFTSPMPREGTTRSRATYRHTPLMPT
jgi:hypothetical protein